MPRKVSENASVAWFNSTDLVEEPGFYVLEGTPEKDENGVKHETDLTPGRRVYPHPDGEGWTTTPTELGSDGTVTVVGDDEEEDGGDK